MGGVFVTWRLVRQVFLLMTAAALGVVAIAPAVAAPGLAGETTHRLTLSPEAAGSPGLDSTFTAVVESSADGGVTWQPAAGETMSFAYVTDGAGLVTAINGGPVGAMTCATDAAGRCTITVRSEEPGDSVVTASVGSVSASAPVG